MKYIIGSLIISFGLLFLIVVILNAMGITAPDNSLQYLGIAWAVLGLLLYPFAKKIIR